MTVQAPTASADQLFTELYVQHWDNIRWWLQRRLFNAPSNLAEDLTQETFIVFLEKYVRPGKVRMETARALLYVIAKNLYLKHNASLRAREQTTLDFTDPVNTPVITTGHRYAAGEPYLAMLGAELDAAMETMHQASLKWRDLHKKIHANQQCLNGPSAPRTEAKRAQVEQRVTQTRHERDDALTHFQKACESVGNLRAELERAGGNWRSTTDMPAGLSKPYTREGAVSADVTLTHCAHGHELHLDNSFFDGEGLRRCRACIAVTGRKNRAKAKPASALAGAAR